MIGEVGEKDLIFLHPPSFTFKFQTTTIGFYSRLSQRTLLQNSQAWVSGLDQASLKQVRENKRQRLNLSCLEFDDKKIASGKFCFSLFSPNISLNFQTPNTPIPILTTNQSKNSSSELSGMGNSFRSGFSEMCREE